MKGFPGNLQDMLQTAQKMQQDMAKLQEEVETKEVSATSGGGMVSVTVNGKQEIVKLAIEADVVNPEDIEMLQDLVQAAVNEAVRQSKALLKEEMSKLTGGISIPGFGA